MSVGRCIQRCHKGPGGEGGAGPTQGQDSAHVAGSSPYHSSQGGQGLCTPLDLIPGIIALMVTLVRGGWDPGSPKGRAPGAPQDGVRPPSQHPGIPGAKSASWTWA